MGIYLKSSLSFLMKLKRYFKTFEKVTNSRNSIEKRTDRNGETIFEFEEGGTVDIYVDGSCVFSDYAYKFIADYKDGLIVKL